LIDKDNINQENIQKNQTFQTNILITKRPFKNSISVNFYFKKNNSIQILQKTKKTNIPTYAVTSDDSQKPTDPKPTENQKKPISRLML
jgi:hypothetical protein